MTMIDKALGIGQYDDDGNPILTQAEQEFNDENDAYDDFMSTHFYDEKGRILKLMQTGRLAKNKEGKYFCRSQIDDYIYRAERHKNMNVYT